MRVVEKTDLQLRFEYLSWGRSLLATSLFLFFGVAVATGQVDAMWQDKALGTLFVVVLALTALMSMETSRVTLDRSTGEVTMFRKLAFSEVRLVLPLAELKGMISEKAYYSRGWWHRPALIFCDGNQTSLIPATQAAARTSNVGLVEDVNAWLNVSLADVLQAAEPVYQSRSDIMVTLADRLGLTGWRNLF